MLSLARGWRNLLLCLGPISPLVALGVLFTYKEMGRIGYFVLALSLLFVCVSMGVYFEQMLKAPLLRPVSRLKRTERCYFAERNLPFAPRQGSVSRIEKLSEPDMDAYLHEINEELKRLKSL